MQHFFTMILFLMALFKIKSFLQNNNNKYFTQKQWKYIIDNNLLENNLIKKKVNEIVYEKYNKLCYFKARNFKKLHKYKCRDIKENELFIHAIIGLFKSIKNYNGNVELIYYANKYITSELYSSITKLQSIKYAKKEDELENLLESKNTKQIERLYENKKYIEYWKIVNNTNNTATKRIAKYKYDFYFNEIRSNSEIANLMCISKETIRKHIYFTKNELKKYISTSSDFINYGSYFTGSSNC